MFKDNKIIIVDNDPDELNKLASVIWKEGIACKAFLYDGFDKPELKGVRVAFFDINLTNLLAPSSSTYDYNNDSSIRDIFHTLAIAIKQYISIDNGPYALIFWTSNQQLIDNFKAFMDQNKQDYSIPNPLYISCIDKSEFISQESTEKNTLYKIVYEQIKNSPVYLLYDLEKKASQAIIDTINEIHSITSDENFSWTKPSNKIRQTFIEIAKATIGKKHVKDHFVVGVIAGINPIINFHMEKIINSSQITNNLFQVTDEEINSKNFDNLNKKCKLNTIFHINKNANPCERGAIYKLNHEMINEYIGDDTDKTKWIKNLINFKSNQKESSIDEIIQNVQVIAVEISPACDFSQKKDRLLKFILGIQSPDIKKSNLSSPNREYIYYPKTLFIDPDSDSVFQFIFNFNYTMSISLSNIKSIGNLLFSLKKEYMDMLTTKYANHIARIGITEFR